MDDNTMAYNWFRDLIRNEIKEELGTIKNERIWENGSPDEITSAMHEDNIAEHEKYIEILKKAYENVIGEECEPAAV